MYKFFKITPKFVVATILLLCILLIITYMKTSDKNPLSLQKSLQLSSYLGRTRFEGKKIVHLDLKGAPFKVSYYSKLFPLLSKLGATGLLMEYEDMFPYSGALLGSIPAYNAYSLTDIYTITASAKKNNLTVIPLIQTFGHMEFMLKLKNYKELREVPQYPQVICPTHENTITLITEMVQQIVRAHPDIEQLHIGCDEVWYLAKCSRCKQFLYASGLNAQQFFLKHVKTIVKEIHKLYPKLRVLMWDDHFRSMTLEDLNKSKIGSLVEPVVWKYTTSVAEHLDSNLWGLYAAVFPRVWIASAFKGATGSNQYLHNATHHIENHKSWLNIVANYQSTIKFEGVFLTGWQRYDHFAVLCELLPVSLPTLGICLRILSGDNELTTHSPDLKDILRCVQLDMTFKSTKCYYPGADVLEVVTKYHNIKKNFNSMVNSPKVKGWIDNYNIKNVFSNPYYVETALSNLEYIRGELMQLQNEIYISMTPIYDNYTINEWYNTYVHPLVLQVDVLYDAKMKLLAKEYWPKRPLNKEGL